MQEVILIPGDGIGPEITEAVKRILKEAGAQVVWNEVQAGLQEYERTGEELPKEVIDSIRTTTVALKGPTATPFGVGHRSVNVRIRQELELYANIRPFVSFPGVSKAHDINFVIVRENTEDLYAGNEIQVSKDHVEGIKLITRAASKRIGAAAGRVLADRIADSIKIPHKPKHHVTIVHKANIMKLADSLFVEGVREGLKFDLVTDEMLVDNCAMQIVTRPQQFDVIVTQNLYGDILSDVAAGMIGGLGLAPGANIGDDFAVFEAVHGTAPDIAGKGLANPTALLLSATMLLRHIGQDEVAARIEKAVRHTICNLEVKTGDLGGTANTAAFTKRVIESL